jgi:hypothetical protein
VKKKTSPEAAFFLADEAWSPIQTIYPTSLSQTTHTKSLPLDAFTPNPALPLPPRITPTLLITLRDIATPLSLNNELSFTAMILIPETNHELLFFVSA